MLVTIINMYDRHPYSRQILSKYNLLDLLLKFKMYEKLLKTLKGGM